MYMRADRGAKKIRSAMEEGSHKSHRQAKAGRKADKKSSKKEKQTPGAVKKNDRARNPKVHRSTCTGQGD